MYWELLCILLLPKLPLFLFNVYLLFYNKINQINQYILFGFEQIKLDPACCVCMNLVTYLFGNL